MIFTNVDMFHEVKLLQPCPLLIALGAGQAHRPPFWQGFFPWKIFPHDLGELGMWYESALTRTENLSVTTTYLCGRHCRTDVVVKFASNKSTEDQGHAPIESPGRSFQYDVPSHDAPQIIVQNTQISYLGKVIQHGLFVGSQEQLPLPGSTDNY